MQIFKAATRFLGSAVVLDLVKSGGRKVVNITIDYGAEKLGRTVRNHGGELKYTDYKDLPKLNLPAGYCYIIRDANDPKRHRLGIASLPSADIEKLKRETPYEIVVVALIECANVSAYERDLTQRLDKKRERSGLWYKLNKSDLRAIDNPDAIVTES